MKRMFIRGYLPAEKVADGLPPLPALPLADGRLPISVVKKRVLTDAYLASTLMDFARTYAKEAVASVAAERDAALVQVESMKADLRARDVEHMGAAHE